MNHDITAIIAGWEFNPDELQVRTITGLDGSEKIQMRIDLGLLQMELSGRPDGDRPHGHESLLDYHESKARLAADAGKEYALDPAACNQLMREGLQYYHRYLSAFHLQKYDLVARDTERNLRLFAFVTKHASRQRDKLEFDRYRPYVIMMRARARALQALTDADFTLALSEIDDGIGRIRQFLREYQQEDNESECAELGFLIRWRREVENERPAGPIERLEHQLELAISLEDYEEAARIRDQLKILQKKTIEARQKT
ncbi:MAG: UvrB/UvrC motif-containing protein [Isosphaeraceae bacterium]